MSMFPHWLGSQKMSVPEWDMLCLNCGRKWSSEISKKKCPFCDSCRTQLAPDSGKAAIKKGKSNRKAGSV